MFKLYLRAGPQSSGASEDSKTAAANVTAVKMVTVGSVQHLPAAKSWPDCLGFREANSWGFDPTVLGWKQMGTDMDDKVAASLRFPDKETVWGYMHRAFAAAEPAVDGIVDEEFGLNSSISSCLGGRTGIGIYVVSYYAYNERHLGQINYLRRLMQLPWKLERQGWISA